MSPCCLNKYRLFQNASPEKGLYSASGLDYQEEPATEKVKFFAKSDLIEKPRC